MAAWCLPRNLQRNFLAAVESGALAPARLAEMSSAERRAEFAKVIGGDNAAEVNAQFEAKLLLKNQKAAMLSWANRVGGLSEATRRDIAATVNRLDRVLQPEDEASFLADLAAKRLGVTVTADEAREVFALSQKAELLRQQIVEAGGGHFADGWTPETGTAYGNAVADLIERVNSLKPHGITFIDGAVQALSLPKSFLTLGHFSAPFVQGWGMMSTSHFWVGIAKMIGYFLDEGNFRDLQGYIIGHPDYALAQDGKLALTQLGDRLTAREEAIQSSLLEHMGEWISARTGLPNLPRASSRGFVGYLNYVRFQRFVDLLNAARQRGEDVRPGSSVVSDLANVVNNFTGRGQLGEGDRYANVAPALNTVFFAPRKIVATVEMFNPVRYLDPRISPTARIAATRQLVGSLLATGAVLLLAKSVGAQVSIDPRDANFMKIGIGGEKLDMTGGNESYLRLLGRIISNQEVTSHGKLVELGQGENAPTRASLMLQWMRNKLSPIARLLADAAVGKDSVGRPFNMTQEMADEFIPITVHSFLNYALNDPGNTAAILPSLGAVFGIGLESPLPPPVQSGRNVWGEPVGWGATFGAPASWRDDPVNQEAEKVGLYLNFPQQKIRGQPLTAQQYDDYVRLSGRLAHMRLEGLVSSPWWSNMPAPQRLTVMKGAIRESREIAASAVMLQSQGTPHDILKGAYQAKLAASGLAVQ